MTALMTAPMLASASARAPSRRLRVSCPASRDRFLGPCPCGRWPRTLPSRMPRPPLIGARGYQASTMGSTSWRRPHHRPCCAGPLHPRYVNVHSASQFLEAGETILDLVW